MNEYKSLLVDILSLIQEYPLPFLFLLLLCFSLLFSSLVYIFVDKRNKKDAIFELIQFGNKVVQIIGVIFAITFGATALDVYDYKQLKNNINQLNSILKIMNTSIDELSKDIENKNEEKYMLLANIEKLKKDIQVEKEGLENIKNENISIKKEAKKNLQTLAYLKNKEKEAEVKYLFTLFTTDIKIKHAQYISYELLKNTNLTLDQDEVYKISSNYYSLKKLVCSSLSDIESINCNEKYKKFFIKTIKKVLDTTEDYLFGGLTTDEAVFLLNSDSYKIRSSDECYAFYTKIISIYGKSAEKSNKVINDFLEKCNSELK